MLDGINIYFLDMPCKIGATIILDEDSNYTIYVNSKLSFEKQRQSLLHELKHINNNDLFSNLSANDIEKLTHEDD